MKYLIPKREKVCFHCQAIFSAGKEYVSTLAEGDNDEWKRRDYCLVCWENGIPHKIFWKSKVHANAPRKIPETRIGQALEVLKRMQKGEQQGSDAEKYVLSLYLHRNKKLSLHEEIIKEGVPYQLYEEPDTEEMFLIPKPRLNTLEVTHLQESILNKFKEIHAPAASSE